MNILFDLLHLVAAAALSLIGFGYEREEACNPVRFEPAALVEPAPAGDGSATDEAVQPIVDCDVRGEVAKLPAL